MENSLPVSFWPVNLCKMAEMIYNFTSHVRLIAFASNPTLKWPELLAKLKKDIVHLTLNLCISLSSNLISGDVMEYLLNFLMQCICQFQKFLVWHMPADSMPGKILFNDICRPFPGESLTGSKDSRKVYLFFFVSAQPDSVNIYLYSVVVGRNYIY